MSYSTPLSERLRLAELHKRKYRENPEYRLRKINRSRAGFGLPPYESVDQIKARGQWAKHDRRDERGRFA